MFLFVQQSFVKWAIWYDIIIVALFCVSFIYCFSQVACLSCLHHTEMVKMMKQYSVLSEFVKRLGTRVVTRKEWQWWFSGVEWVMIWQFKWIGHFLFELDLTEGSHKCRLHFVRLRFVSYYPLYMAEFVTQNS